MASLLTPLVAWLLFSGAFALVTVRRPAWSCAAVLVVWSLLPSTAAALVTGADSGPLATHPATWLALAVLVVQVVARPRSFSRTVADHQYLWLALALFVLVALATTLAAGGAGAKIVADQVVGPLALFAVVTGPVADGRRPILLLRTAVVLVAALQSVVALAQFFAGSVLVYEQFFLRLYWFDPSTQDRWMGTTDTPLVLSLLVAAAAPLVVAYRSACLRLALLGLYVLAAAVTQSRVGLAMAALVMVYVLVRARTGPLQRLGMAVLVAATGWFVAGSVVLAGVQGRFGDDTGSTQARADALTFFAQHFWQYLLVGDGSGASYDVARNSGLVTSLENPLMMYAIDVGVVFSLLYFGVQLVLPLLSWPLVRTPGLAVAASVAVVMQLSFSSVGAANLVGTVVWLLLGLLLADAAVTRRERVEAGTAPVESPTQAPTQASGQASGAPAARSAATSVPS